jgi:hypothetical protein
MGTCSEEMFKSIPKYLVLKPFDQVLQFDMDPAIPHGLDRIGEFDQLAGSGFRVGVGALGCEFHQAGPTRSRCRFMVNS